MMRLIVWPITLAFLLLGSAESAAQERVPLATVVREAMDNPQAQAEEAQAMAASAAAKATRRGVLFPRLSASASANVRDREFTLETPVGDFGIAERTFLQGRVRLEQSIADLPGWRQASAARTRKRAASLSLKHVARQEALEASEIYFDLLTLEARLEANQSYIQSLQQGNDRVNALVAEERAVASDLLRTRLAVQAAEQEDLAMRQRRSVLALALGHAMGRDGEVLPAPLAPPMSPLQASSARPDLLALRTQAQALADEANAVGAEWLPRLVARGEAVYTDAGPQSETFFLQGSLNLVWTATGDRSARRDALAAKRKRVLAQLEHAERGRRVAVREAQASVAIAQGYLALADTRLAEARENVRVVRARYEAGRETITQVLDAEAVLRDAAAQRLASRVESARGHMRLRFQQGGPLHAETPDLP